MTPPELWAAIQRTVAPPPKSGKWTDRSRVSLAELIGKLLGSEEGRRFLLDKLKSGAPFSKMARFLASFAGQLDPTDPSIPVAERRALAAAAAEIAKSKAPQDSAVWILWWVEWKSGGIHAPGKVGDLLMNWSKGRKTNEIRTRLLDLQGWKQFPKEQWMSLLKQTVDEALSDKKPTLQPLLKLFEEEAHPVPKPSPPPVKVELKPPTQKPVTLPPELEVATPVEKVVPPGERKAEPELKPEPPDAEFEPKKIPEPEVTTSTPAPETDLVEVEIPSEVVKPLVLPPEEPTGDDVVPAEPTVGGPKPRVRKKIAEPKSEPHPGLDFSQPMAELTVAIRWLGERVETLSLREQIKPDPVRIDFDSLSRRIDRLESKSGVVAPAAQPEFDTSRLEGELQQCRETIARLEQELRDEVRRSDADIEAFRQQSSNAVATFQGKLRVVFERELIDITEPVAGERFETEREQMLLDRLRAVKRELQHHGILKK